jgi:hypothetical protein
MLFLVGAQYPGSAWGRIGAWYDEARRVSVLADALGITVDTQRLLYCDVHDLMALQSRLEALRDGRPVPRHCGPSGVLATPPSNALVDALLALIHVKRRQARQHGSGAARLG